MDSPFHSTHLIRYLSKDISQICAPLFEKFGVGYLHYAKMYLDGSTTMLFSNMAWSDYFFEKNYKANMSLPDKDSIILGQPNIFLWEGTDSGHYIKDASQLFDMHHPLAINTLYDDHLESIVICLNKHHKHDINNYFTNIELMLMMLNDIKEQCKPLISDLEKLQIIYPEKSRPKQLELVKHSIEGILVNGNAGQVKLSFKELEIIQQLRYGYGLPEIADNLSRSRRTIEAHINNIKHKLACKKRSELVLLAIREGIVR